MENKEDYIDVPRDMLKSLKRDLKAALGPVPDIPRLSDEQRKEAYNRGVKVFGLTLNECIEQLVNRLSSRQRRGFKWKKKHFVSGFQIPKSGHITFRFGKDGAISINHLIYRLYCNEIRMAQLTCKEEIYRLCCKVGCGNPEHLIFIGMKEANRRRICQKSQEDCDHEPKCIRKKRQLIPLPDAHQEVDEADDVAMDLVPEEVGLEGSHRCHTKDCINPKHIIMESGENKTKRNLCKGLGLCWGSAIHDPPKCVFKTKSRVTIKELLNNHSDTESCSSTANR